MDGKYIVIFHQAILGSNEPEVKKKSASLKSKVFHYLLSHVAAWPNVYARAGLLRAVSGIVDPVKSALIVPILNEVVKSTVVEREELSAGLSIEMIKQYAGLLLGPYEGVSKKFLESTEHTALDTFLRSLEITDDTGKHTNLIFNQLGAKMVSYAIRYRSYTSKRRFGYCQNFTFRYCSRGNSTRSIQEIGEIIFYFRFC